MDFLWPVVQGLSESQSHLFILLQAVVRRHQAGAVPGLIDTDVAEAASALAATFETADRGIIYEHQAASVQAQGLARKIKATLDRLMKDARPSAQRHAAVVLRRLERAARTADEALGKGARSYLELLDRLPSEDADTAGHEGSAASQTRSDDSPGLIVP